MLRVGKFPRDSASSKSYDAGYRGDKNGRNGPFWSGARSQYDLITLGSNVSVVMPITPQNATSLYNRPVVESELHGKFQG